MTNTSNLHNDETLSSVQESVSENLELEPRYEYVLRSPTEKPDASAFLWNSAMMLNINCRGYANAQFMQPEPSKYAFSPSLEAKTFMQPEHPYFEHHPGRFFYIKDLDTNELFSLPFAPCNKEPDSYQFIVRPNEVVWQVEYLGLSIELSLCLATDTACEYWKVALTNTQRSKHNIEGNTEGSSERNTAENYSKRRIEITTYFPLGYMSWMNQSANLDTKSQSIIAEYVTPYQKLEDYPALKKTAQKTIFSADKDYSTWCANQTAFEGFGGLSSPSALQINGLPNTPAFYETPAACMQFVIELERSDTTKQSEQIHFAFGPIATKDEALSFKEKHLAACKLRFADNHSKPSPAFPLTVETQDTEFNKFINCWLPRQVFYHGDVNRLTTDPQTRNYIQDNIGMCYLKPESAEKCLLTALSQQKRSGEMPDGILIHPDAELKYINQVPHSDHCIWLPLLLEAYLNQTNDTAILDEKVCFQDSDDKLTVSQHIELALGWVLSKRDARGLCFIEQGDWCDPMNMVGPKGIGVSAWLTLALAYAIKVWIRIIKNYQLGSAVVSLQDQLNSLRSSVIEHCWDGQWFARGITDNNEVFGTHKDLEGKIFLNPQSWSLLAGITDKAYKDKILRSVDEHLQTPYGNQMLAPCYTEMDERVGRVTQKFPGSAENGSVYNHAFAFWIYAMFESDEPDKGLLNIQEMLAATRSSQAGQLPVYVPNYFRGAYKQFPEVAGKSSHLFNTGTAAWLYRTVIEQLFGLRGEASKLIIEPKMNQRLGACKATYVFRGAKIALSIRFCDTSLQQQTFVNGRLVLDNCIESPESSVVYDVDIVLPSARLSSFNKMDYASDTTQAPKLLIVCGVSGAGKTRLAASLAKHYDAMLIEGDDYHSRASRDKMAQGIPLDDKDREPWVDRMCEAALQKLKHGYDTVVCFSGLKAKHRKRLLAIHAKPRLLMLEVSETILKQRLENRKGHFFSPKLLSSQLSSMESLNRLEMDDGATVINNDLDDYEQMLEKVIEAIANTK